MFKILSQDCFAFLHGVKSVQSQSPSLGLMFPNSFRLALICKMGVTIAVSCVSSYNLILC